MLKKANIFLILFFLFYSHFCFSINLDSLNQTLKADINDTIKLSVYKILLEEDTTISKNLYKIFLDEAIDLASKTNNLKYLAYFKRQQAEFLFENRDLGNATLTLLEALKICESLNDLKGQSSIFNKLGAIYYEVDNLEKAELYFKKALVIEDSLKNYNGLANNYNNLAAIHFQKNEYDLSIEYFEKALEIYKNINDKQGVIDMYSNISSVYIYIEKFDKAEYYLKESLKFYLSINDFDGLGMIYNNLGFLYKEQGKYYEAIANFNLAIEIAKNNKMISEMVKYTFNLAETYNEMGESNKAYETLLEFVDLKDSLIYLENNKLIHELSIKYETEKKEKENELLKKEGEIKDLTIKSQKTLSIAIGSGLGIVLILSFFIYNRYKLTQKQKSIIEHQKVIVEEKNKEITDSITYAKRIQDAILPDEQTLQRYMPQSFILYLPKDIVAGDFYWLNTLDDHLLFAVADCTGHGVPGAMVSVVCHTALNRAVKEFELTKPSEILDKTRELVIETIANNNSFIQDGMDIALVNLNFKQNKLQYSGAHNSLYIVRNNEIIELKADRQPVGNFMKNKPFTNYEFEIEKNDMLYLFSDGYADQFGGEKAKKFMTKNFKALLVEINNLPMEEQHKRLKEAFIQWKGLHEQIDDVCVAGIRVV